MRRIIVTLALLAVAALSGCVGETSKGLSYGVIVNVEERDLFGDNTDRIWVLHDKETVSESFGISENDANPSLIATARHYQETGERVRVTYHNLRVFSCFGPNIACDEVLAIEAAPLKR